MKLETHCHTKLRSPCANVEPSIIPHLYKQKKYDGIIVTDHYMQWLFDEYYPQGSMESKINFFLQGYKDVKVEAEKIGLKTFLGVELTLSSHYETYPLIEYLLYGMTEEFFLKNPYLFNLSDSELRSVCVKNNIAMFQSHPFRGYAERAEPKNLDGVEIFNLNARHDSHNETAQKYALDNRLLMLAGNDFHEDYDVAGAGIIVSDKIKTNQELFHAIKNNEYKICIENI